MQALFKRIGHLVGGDIGVNMSAWEDGIQFVLDQEGGYVNDPKDPGGETKFGISKRSYPSIDISKLTIEDAKVIYKRDYWTKCSCDQLPEKTSICVLDTAVNMGTNKAVRFLQIALKLEVDGVVGPKTILAAHKTVEKDTLETYLALRAKDYCEIVLNRPESKKFSFGWMKRLFSLADIVLEG